MQRNPVETRICIKEGCYSEMQKMIKDKLKSVYELEKVTYEKIFKHGMDYSVVMYHSPDLVYFIS